MLEERSKTTVRTLGGFPRGHLQPHSSKAKSGCQSRTRTSVGQGKSHIKAASKARTAQTYSLAQTKSEGPELSFSGSPVLWDKDCGVETPGEAY